MANQNILSESNKLLKKIIDLAPGNIYWKDLNGVYLGCNDNMAKMVGLTSEEIVGKTDYDLVWREFAEQLQKNDLLVITTGITHEFEERGKLVSGEKIIAITKKIPFRDNKNNIIGVLGISLDITEKRILEKQLEQLERTNKRFIEDRHKKVVGNSCQLQFLTATDLIKNITDYLENIIALSPGNLYWKNLDGFYLGCNDNMAGMVGLTRQEVIGKTDRDLIWHEAADNLRKNDLLVMQNGITLEFEEAVFTADNENKTVITNKVPLYDENNKIIGILGTSIDITEKKLLEEKLHEAKLKEKAQEERIDTIKSVGASIAHELRTPLRSIINNAQIKRLLPDLIDAYEKAKAANLDIQPLRTSQIEGIKEGLEDIETEAKYASSVIDMLLINIRELEDIQDSFKSLSMLECINKTLNRYPCQSEEQRKLIHWNQKNNFAFVGDERLITQILFNLLRNALFFIAKARKGEIKIWLKKGKKVNTLYFEDTSEGIKKEILQKIFDPFYTKREMGTGLGLSFSKMAMQKMDGNIICESEFGKYARFILTFPA